MNLNIAYLFCLPILNIYLSQVFFVNIILLLLPKTMFLGRKKKFDEVGGGCHFGNFTTTVDKINIKQKGKISW